MIDRDDLRRRLNSDRVWSIYALADLDPGMFEQCDWRTSGDTGLALVFRGISIMPIFVLGDAEEARELLKSLELERGYLNLRDHQAGQEIYRYEAPPHRMHRMVVQQFRPASSNENIVRLTREDAAEVEALYATGDGGGVAFGGFQLDTGFFRGIRRNGELVAVAGVHVVSRNESVAGAGNVFTRPDCRGQKLAQAATAAVVAALIAAGIETIGLNVEHDNSAAIAAYENLGFRKAFAYWEGTALKIEGRV